MEQQLKFNRSAKALFAVRPLARLLCWALGLGLSATLSVAGAAEAPNPGNDRLAPVKARLAKQYPDVQHLSIESYLEQHADALLVDVRAKQEYAVSRIPGAIHIEDRAKLLAFARQHPQRQLILYCSVGARSADAARFLQQQAKRDPLSTEARIGPVANLAGSIFEWANERRPLVNDAGPTQEVHSYNAWWGWRYLDN